jgi:hypothetical protein
MLAGNRVECSGSRLKVVEKMAAQEERKTGRMTWFQVDIFIHVEDIDFAPVDAGGEAQRFQEGELRITGCQDHVGLASLLDGLLQEGGCICRSRLSNITIGVKYTDWQSIDGG